MAIWHDDRFHATLSRICTLTNAVPCHYYGLGLIVVVPIGEQFVPHDDILLMLLLEIDAKFFHKP